MRHPVLTAFAMMSFIGAGCFALACSSNSGPEIEAITGVGSAQPAADDPDAAKTITIPTKKKTPKDAGTPDTGGPVGVYPDAAPPSGDDDDDDDDDVLVADCPQDQAHLLSYTLILTTGGGTECTSHGNECNTNECCYVYPVPGLGQNYCLPQ